MATKEQRQARRAQRQQRRAAQKQRIEQIISAANNLPEVSDDASVESLQADFTKYWSVLKEVLEWAANSNWVGKKTKNALLDVIALGDQAADAPTDADANRKFVQAANKYWKTVRVILNVVTVWTNDAQDKTIQKIILIGDILTDNDSDDDSSNLETTEDPTTPPSTPPTTPPAS